MKKKYFLLFTAVCLFTARINAQQDTSKIREVDFSTLPYFAWGSGIGITSPDSLFQVNFRFRMQNRLSVDLEEGEVESFDSRVRRFRIKLDGYVAHPSVTYLVELALTNEDMGDVISGNSPNIINDAMMFYSPNKNWRFGFGQAKLPGNRERIVSSGSLQLADRSQANGVFNIDRDFGLQAYYKSGFESDFQFLMKAAITSGEGRNWVSSPELNLCYTGRIEFLPFGFFTKGGDYFQGDLMREKNPKLSVAFAYNYNNEAERSGGQRGSLLYENKNINNFYSDLIFKYNGWAFMSEFMRRYAIDPVTINPNDPTQEVFVYNGFGFTVQGSYNFECDFEIVGRYSATVASDEIIDLVPEESDYYTLGFNQYIWAHTFKLQLDATYIENSFLNTLQNNDSWNFRFQVELGI